MKISLIFTDADYEAWLQNPDHSINQWNERGLGLQWCEYLLQHDKSARAKNGPSKKPGPRKADCYRYFVTFTLKDTSDSKQRGAYRQIMAYSQSIQFKAKEWYVVQELGSENKRPHWHCLIVSETGIKKDFFRTYEKVFGTVDFKKISVGTDPAILKYMSKENKPKNIINIINTP